MRRALLASRDELKSLATRIGTRPFDSIYSMLRTRCGLTLQTAPTTEVQWRALCQQGQPAALRAARTAQGRIIDLLVAHHVDRNLAYRDRAIEELKSLLAWSTWVDPRHEKDAVDLCTAEVAVAATIGLDWLYEDLPEVDRLRVTQALRHRVIEPYRRSVQEKAWWYQCSDSHNAVINSGCGLAALALSDEQPICREVYQMARTGLTRFFAALGREGGWEEGLSHWGYAMRYVLLLADASSRVAKVHSLYHVRGMDATGLFPVYFTPNGQYAGFGDQPGVPLHGALYLLVKRYGLRELTWWLDSYAFHRDASLCEWSAAGLALVARPSDAEMVVDPELQTVKVFNEIGWAAMADRWPQPRFYVSAKTGDLSASHSRRDMCSLQVQLDGEMLLCDGGLAPFDPMTGQGQEYADLQAASHNTILVGQRDHRIDAQGSVIEAQDDGDFRWLACDGGAAFGEDVHVVRHVMMVCTGPRGAGSTLLVLDEIHNSARESIELFWHSGGRIVAATDCSGMIQGSKAKLHYAMAATTPLQTAVLDRKLGTRQENILHVQLQAATKAMVLTAFSREPLCGRLEIRKSGATDVRVKAGGAVFHMRTLKKHLQLQEVSL